MPATSQGKYRNYKDKQWLDSKYHINVITLCRKCHGKTKNREYEFVTKYHTIVGLD